jgi:hypothetical protein
MNVTREEGKWLFHGLPCHDGSIAITMTHFAHTRITHWTLSHVTIIITTTTTTTTTTTYCNEIDMNDTTTTTTTARTS